MQRLVLPTRLERTWRVKRVLVRRPKSRERPPIRRQPSRETATRHVATQLSEHGVVHVFEGVVAVLGTFPEALQKMKFR